MGYAPPSPNPSSHMAVRRLSVRHLLLLLCLLVTVLLLVILRGVYDGTIPSIVVKYTRPTRTSTAELRNPFSPPQPSTPRPSEPPSVHAAQAALWSVPEISQLSEMKGLNNDGNNYKYYTESKLRQLTACLARRDCHRNAEKVLIIASLQCHWGVFGGYMGGEGVWCNGMIESLERQGYTVLFARNDWPYVAHIYRQIPDMVKAIIGDDDGGKHGKAKDYFRSAARPDSFPAWKFFRFYYFPTPKGTVISSYWCVSAEIEWRDVGMGNYRNNTYLGYALEPASETRTVPWDRRPNRAYILGKKAAYFHTYLNTPPYIPGEFITRAYHELRKDIPDFEFVGNFIDDRSEEDKKQHGEFPIPEGIRLLGKMNATQFDDEVAKSKVMVGIGYPVTSPSPYRALARGVPFLNPHSTHPWSKPDVPSTWKMVQHDTLRTMKPPLVYQTEKDNYDVFISALRTAMATPIEPYIPYRLTPEALDARMDSFMNHDWRSEAERILNNRKAGKESELGEGLGMFEL